MPRRMRTDGPGQRDPDDPDAIQVKFEKFATGHKTKDVLK